MAALLPVPGEFGLLMVTAAWDTSTLTALWNPETGKACVTCCGAGDPCPACTDDGLTTPEQITITFSGLTNRTGCQPSYALPESCCDGFGDTYKYVNNQSDLDIFDLASVLNDNAVTLTQNTPCVWQVSLPVDSGAQLIYSDSACGIISLLCVNTIESVFIQAFRGPIGTIGLPAGQTEVRINITPNVGDDTPVCDFTRMRRSCDSAECIACEGAFTFREDIGAVNTSSATFTIDEL